MNDIVIRLETESDYREVEELTRNAFWNVYKPGADEHSFDVARKMGYDVNINFGNPGNYVSRGFVSCKKQNGIPYVLGKTWTTDSFYRETRNNFEKRKADGCISVEMECAGVQAMCSFRGLELYPFFTGGDLLDAPEWDERGKDYLNGGQHDVGHFNIALALAEYIS